MTARSVLVAAGAFASAAVIALGVYVALRWSKPQQAPAAALAPTPAAEPGRKIKANLFYVADDGLRLVAMQREVPYGEGSTEQAKAIVTAQLAPPAAPLISPVPPATTLRALFVSAKGEAYVDLSRQFAAAQTGGTTDELLAVYAIVDVLTTNLPAITSVQVLVDGKEVDTLAGHVDLRRPLAQNLAWVQ